MGILKVAGGTVAAVAVLATSVPAAAQDRRGGERRHHHRAHDRFDLGDALVGAAIVGGLLALTSGEQKRRERADAAYDEEYETVAPVGTPADYDGTYTTELAQERCTDEVETQARAYAPLSRISAVSSTMWNGIAWEVKGQVELAESESDGIARTRGWRCSLRAGSAPVVTFAGL